MCVDPAKIYSKVLTYYTFTRNYKNKTRYIIPTCYYFFLKLSKINQFSSKHNISSPESVSQTHTCWNGSRLLTNEHIQVCVEEQMEKLHLVDKD